MKENFLCVCVCLFVKIERPKPQLREISIYPKHVIHFSHEIATRSPLTHSQICFQIWGDRAVDSQDTCHPIHQSFLNFQSYAMPCVCLSLVVRVRERDEEEKKVLSLSILGDGQEGTHRPTNIFLSFMRKSSLREAFLAYDNGFKALQDGRTQSFNIKFRCSIESISSLTDDNIYIYIPTSEFEY